MPKITYYEINDMKISNFSFKELISFVVSIFSKESNISINKVESDLVGDEFERISIKDARAELLLIIEFISKEKKFNEEKLTDFLQRVFKSIPDKTLSIQEKTKFISENYGNLKDRFENLDYSEPVYIINGKKSSDFNSKEIFSFISSMKLKKYDEIRITRKDNGTSLIIEDKATEFPFIIESMLKNGIDRMLTRKKLFFTEETIAVIKKILKSIPDSMLNVREKASFLKKNYPHLAAQFENIAYAESTPILEITDKTSKTKINLAEYQQATNQTIDHSDYIVLTIGLLRSLLKEDQFKKELEEIEKEYFELNYDECNLMIKNLCNALKSAEYNEDINLEKACNTIIKIKSVEVEPEKNDTRRFYENKFSQYALGYINKHHLNLIENITASFLGINDIQNVEEAIGELAEWSIPETAERCKKFKKKRSPKYKIKDRALRGGFLDSEDEAMGNIRLKSDPEYVTRLETTLSMNPGALRSNSPNFRDELTELPIRNRLPDIFEIPKSEKGYSRQNERNRAAFVSSISGHTFFVIAMLEHHIESLKDDQKDPKTAIKQEELEQEIKIFLLGYISVLAKRGYHSVHEVLDVWREPKIKKTLKKKIKELFPESININLELQIDPSILTQSMNDALAYSKANVLKRSMHNELLGKTTLQFEILELTTSLQELKEKFKENKMLFNSAYKNKEEPQAKERLSLYGNFEIPEDILDKFERLKASIPKSTEATKLNAIQKKLQKEMTELRNDEIIKFVQFQKEVNDFRSKAKDIINSLPNEEKPKEVLPLYKGSGLRKLRAGLLDSQESPEKHKPST